LDGSVSLAWQLVHAVPENDDYLEDIFHKVG